MVESPPANDAGADRIRSAEVVLPCGELDPTLAFFTERLGFRVEAIFPADAPTVAVVSGHGLRVRLDRSARGEPGVLRLECDDPEALAGGARELTAPNGTRVLLAEFEPGLVLPPAQPSFIVCREGEGARWRTGRAGMQYRDLIPGRQGGRYVASHIRIPAGGEVPDYVHFHRIRFQVIYCYRGWVRVVYEDQGPPLVLEEGDCVLQPPEIRHRVLECSPGLEVIELGSPAEHETRSDPELVLPTTELRPERAFGAQRFHHHRASDAAWRPSRWSGFECRETGVAEAAGGVGGVRVHRILGSAAPRTAVHRAELLFLFVLRGKTELQADDLDPSPLAACDCAVIPPGLRHALARSSGDLELLEVSLPAALEARFDPEGLSSD